MKAAVRQKREEQKGRNRRLSSQKESGSGRKEAEAERKMPNGQAPEEQLWERIREGRKETYRNAEYRNRGRMHGKPGRREWGKPKKRKRKRSTVKATVRRKQEDKGKEETEAE